MLINNSLTLSKPIISRITGLEQWKKNTQYLWLCMSKEAIVPCCFCRSFLYCLNILPVLFNAGKLFWQSDSNLPMTVAPWAWEVHWKQVVITVTSLTRSGSGQTRFFLMCWTQYWLFWHAYSIRYFICRQTSNSGRGRNQSTVSPYIREMASQLNS